MHMTSTSPSQPTFAGEGRRARPRTRRATAIVTGALAITLLLCSAVVLVVFDPLHARPSTVARLFSIALVENNFAEATSLSSPSVRDAIQQWASHRTPIRCPPSPDEDDVPGFSICSSHDTPMEAKCSLDLYCWPLNYEFHIDAIRLRRHGITWRVFDWKAICESTTHECR